MALLRQFSGDDDIAFYDERTGQFTYGKSNKNPDVSAYPEHATGDGVNDLTNESSSAYALLQNLIEMSNQQTEAQNKLQLQMMREANGITVAEGARQREFNAAEALKAFQRSEQSRLAAQEYNTSERLAAQEWQENMSNTQYQRAVKDLYEAGLNPLLAVGAQASYGNVSPGRSSASQGYAASSSAGHGTSSSAYRSNVESLINGVLSYMTEAEKNDVQRDASVLGFIGKILSSVISDFSYSKGSYKGSYSSDQTRISENHNYNYRR